MSVREIDAQMNEALLLVDFQRDFPTFGGRMPVRHQQIDGVIASANHAIKAALEHGAIVVKVGNADASDYKREAALAPSQDVGSLS